MKSKIKEYIKKYSYHVSWSEDDECYIAKALEYPSIMAHGKSESQAIKECKSALFTALEWVEEDGGKAPEPVSSLKATKYPLPLTADERKELEIQRRVLGFSTTSKYIKSKLFG